MQCDKQAILVAVLTRQGDKTWNWYAASGEDAEERISDVLATFESLPVHMHKTDDPELEGYLDFRQHYIKQAIG